MDQLPPATTSTATAAAAATAGQAPPRTKSKAYQTTIAAEADDLKYESKYKELKKKVKEVEEDNEHLHVKILQAQQSIQRLRLERALIYERLASMPLPSTEPQAVTTPDAGHQHHHAHTSNVHHLNQSTPSSHQPHPLSQSFTPSSISHANGPSTHQQALSSNPVSAPITPTSHSREVYPQYSPSIRGGQDRALPPMKEAPDEHHHISSHRPHNTLPPISPAQYKEGRGYLPPPSSSARESGERDSVHGHAPRRHSPGPYNTSSSHISSSSSYRRENNTHDGSQYSHEDPHSYSYHQKQYIGSAISDQRSSIGHITASPLSHSRTPLGGAERGRMEVDEIGTGVKYDSRA